MRLLRFCCVLDHLICFTSPVNTFLRYNAFTLCNGEFGMS
ncbi:chorismate lyase, partial [Escherichia coli]